MRGFFAENGSFHFKGIALWFLHGVPYQATVIGHLPDFQNSQLFVNLSVIKIDGVKGCHDDLFKEHGQLCQIRGG